MSPLLLKLYQNHYLWVGTRDSVDYLLILMSVLFFASVTAYLLVSINKKTPKLNRRFILGKWQREGRTTEGEAWQISYTFLDKKRFAIAANPTFNLSGNYQVIKEIENLLVIQLHNLTGDGDTQNQVIQVAIDKKSKQLMIDSRIYQRIN